MSSEELINQSIAYQLKSRFGDQFDYAWIFNRKNIGPYLAGQVYFSRLEPGVCPVSSPVIKLIQGVFEIYRDQSFFLLRQRIWATSEPTQTDLAMVDLAAKRVRQIKSVKADAETINFNVLALEEVGIFDQSFSYELPKITNFENLKGQHIKNKIQLEEQLMEIEKNARRDLRFHDSERPIAAILLDHENKILMATQHLGVVNKTFHAEVLLCQKFYFEMKNLFPEKSRLVVSLKPCRMCSQMISEMSSNLKSFEVVYKIDDPGSKSRNLSLEKSKQLLSWQQFNL